PDILPVDEQGRKRTHGKRVNICPNSPSFRRFSREIARRMADRYSHHPALVMWHVANEYGTYCYCENCEAAFRTWLRDRYRTVDELNGRWNTAFWGHTVYNWDEIVVPSERNDDNKWYQPIMLDYLRFMTDANIACFNKEADVLRAATPHIPVMTNMSGFIKKIDQFKMTASMDIVGWDNYPSPKDDRSLVAFKHDLMRGLKGGQSYLMVEQSPGQQNWQPYNVLKRPGEVRRLSFQAIAHGSDSVLYFQLRQSVAGVEKFHAALIAHAGHEETRVFRECARIGAECRRLGDAVTGARSPARVGILFDWDNWRALELSSGPSRDLQYLPTVVQYYKAFHARNIPVDVLPYTADFNGYDLLITPLMYMLKPVVADRITRFVRDGGHLLTSFFSGLVDENDRVILGGYPGGLRDVLGIWVEETDALLPGATNSLRIVAPDDNLQGSYRCSLLCDLVHLRGAKALAVYGEDFYAGMPCLTEHDFGKGKAWYVATAAEDRLLADLAGKIIARLDLKAPLDVPQGIEVTRRIKEGRDVLFVISHLADETTIDLGPEPRMELITGARLQGTVTLPAGDVLVLQTIE
ncbi:MAG: beta-galactosidase, partial [Bacillota bacterium]|nr:beta-galactosidase [Bacillota bacterium]